MADIAALALSVNSDQVKQATVALHEMVPAATAAERAAQRWGTAIRAASQSSDDFARRVNQTIKSLEFQRQQLQRSAAEQERYNALRRAGVTELSAEGIAIGRAVAALQTQRAATQQAAESSRSLSGSFGLIGRAIAPLAAAFTAAAIAQRAWAAGMKAADLGEQAEQVGLTTDLLQAYRLEAVQNGLTVEDLSGTLNKFTATLGQASKGQKESIELFQKLNVKILDSRGELRKESDLLPEVARSLLAMGNETERNTLLHDLFGRAGQRSVTMLESWAKGSDRMVIAAQAQRAVLDTETIAAWDRVKDSLAKVEIQSEVAYAKLGAPIATSGLQALESLLKSINVLMEQIGSNKGFWSTILEESRSLGRIGSGPNALRLETPQERDARMLAEKNAELNKPASQGRESMIQEEIDAIRQRQLAEAQAAQGGIQARGAASGRFPFAPPASVGTGLPKVTGAGQEAENAEKKYAKLITTLTQTAAAQDAMTAAAGRGEVAFEATKVHLEAQSKALEIYGKALDDTDPKLRKIEELLLRIAQGKAAEAFSVATTELEKQNVILQKQIDLMGEAPEIQAREIALIKAKQDAEKAGTAVTADMIEQRRKAIEQNETLKTQQEELKRAQDLWTAPLKSALESIQSTAADAFQGMLESGKISFQSLGDIFKKTITRMAAEFLALATVRPVMSVILNAVSPSTAQQMGLSSTGGSTLGGGGLFGSLSGLGGGISDFLGQTLIGGSANFGPVMEGQTFASLGTSGGLSVGGALGGLAGIGMGAYSLFSGGGSTGSMIGGGLGIAGGLTSLAGPLLGLGAAAGPIGLGIGLLGSILPSLFGGQTKPTITNQAYGQVSYGAGGFGTSGGAWGPSADSSALTGSLGQIGSSMDAVFKAFGGVKDAGKVWGVALQSFSQQYGDDSTFSNQTSFLVGPGGQQRQWGQGSTEGDVGMGAAGVAATLNSILGGAVGDISDNMRRALEGVNLSGKDTFETLGTVVTEIMAFDEAVKGFGKTTTDAEAAIQAVDDSFTSLYATAEKYSLDIVKLDQERDRQRLKATEDFTRGITQDLLGFTDPLQAQLNDLDKQREESLANNADFVRLVTGYNDQAANIEQLYYLRRNEVIDQANAAALAAQQQASNAIVSAATASLGQLQGLIAQLSPGGALSNLDPAGQLAGLRATYSAAYAQAQADPSNADAISRTVAAGQSLAQFSQSYYGGSTAYSRERDMILGQTMGLQVGVATSAMNRVSDTQAHSYLSQIANNTSGLPERIAQIETAIGLLTRYVANQAA